MSSNNSNCTCTCSCTRTESVTKNGHTVEKTTHVDSKRNPDGLYTTKTTSVDTIIDPQGHKTSKTSTNTETGKEVDFDSKIKSNAKGIGDSLFMSPEMMKEEEYDNKTDIFSFGIVLYFIFVGKMPGQTMKEKVMGKQIKMPEESPSINKCCIDLMSKCLDNDPKERPSFNEILNILRDNKFMLADDVDPSIVSQRDQELESFK